MFPLFVDFDQAKARWGKCNCSEKTLQQSSQQNTCDSICALVDISIMCNKNLELLTILNLFTGSPQFVT